MPRPCTACISENREGIDAAIVERVPFRDIARRWNISKDAAMRHRIHVSAALVAVHERKEASKAESLSDRVEQLYDRASHILDDAEASGRATVALSAVRELRAVVELLARLSGELDERPQTSVLNLIASPDWIDIRGTVLDALVPYPDARTAVASRLLVAEAAS